MVDFARAFGVASPGTAAYAPKITHGKQIDNTLVWRLRAEDGRVTTRVPKADMPGYLPTSIEGLNDNWSVHVVDKARPEPNHRALPVRDGRAFAQLDLAMADSDLFIGHPVTCGNLDVRLLVSWKEEGKWYVEAHNPGDKAVETTLTTCPDWPLFTLNESVALAAGTSRIWVVDEL